MEDRLRQVFDNLDEKETDELIKPEYEFTCSLDEERIRNMVFEKTGVLPVKKKRFHIDSRIVYMFGGMAAGILIAASVFLFASGYLGDKDYGKLVNNNGDGKIYKEDTVIKYPDGALNKEEAGSFAEPEDEDKTIEDKDKSDKNENPDKTDNKDNGSDDRKSPGKISNPSIGVAVGKSAEITGLDAQEIEELLDKYSSEIDMSYFKAEYDTVEDMISYCDFIVRGIKKSEKLYQTDNEDEYYFGSRFQVSSVLGQRDSEESIADKVLVREGIIVDEQNKTCIYRGGYVKMSTGNEYILFLKYSDKGYYKIAGTVYGKVPLAEDEEILNIGEYTSNPDIENVYTIVEYARDQYKDYSPEATTAPQPEEIEPDSTVEPAGNMNLATASPQS